MIKPSRLAAPQRVKVLSSRAQPRALTFGRRAGACFAFILALSMSIGSAAAQQGAAPPPAPAAAPATPPPGSPAVVAAPPPNVQYAQPAPPPYYYGQPAYGQAPLSPYGQPQQPVRPRARPRRGLMVAGISMLGGSYLVSVISGAVLIDMNEYECRHCDDVGPLLFIPLVGPFLGISEAHQGDAFLVLLGLLQLAGTGLTVGGVIQFRRSKKELAAQGYYTLHLPQGRSLSFDMSASPARLGPSARLRF